jgi:ribosomal protein L33
VCSECGECYDFEDHPSDANAALNNVYSSRAAMEASGWEIALDVLPGDSPLFDSKCGGMAIPWYGAVGHMRATLLANFTGSGQGSLEFGNCWSLGYVYVYLAGQVIAAAGPNEFRVAVSFAYKNGDVLELRDQTSSSVIALHSVRLSQASHGCSAYGSGRSQHGNDICCTADSPCPFGVGNCESDDQCVGALKCRQGIGQTYGYLSNSVGVCGQEDFITARASPLAGWNVLWGSCTVSGTCVQSSRYPQAYTNNSRCDIVLQGEPVPLHVETFNTESGYDFLQVNGQRYDGSFGPQGVVPTGALVWSSDAHLATTGWRICVGNPAPVYPEPEEAGETLVEEESNFVMIGALAGGALLLCSLGVFVCYRKKRSAALSIPPSVAGQVNAPRNFNEVPAYWNNGKQSNVADETFEQMTYCDPGTHKYFEEILRASYRDKVTQDRPCPKGTCPRTCGGCACFRPGGAYSIPKGFQVERVIRVEDSKMWSRYTMRRDEIRQKRVGSIGLSRFKPPVFTGDVSKYSDSFEPLDSQVNEIYLWHGTDVRAALNIMAEGFQVNRKGSAMYGHGVYLAESSTKADEYSRDERNGYYRGVYALLLCRVCMGRYYYTTERDVYAGGRVSSGKYDSTCGDRARSADTFREFVVYDQDQIYPEYLVLYSRVYKAGDTQYTPPLLPRPYFMQVPLYWRNAHKNPEKTEFHDQIQATNSVKDILQLLVDETNKQDGKVTVLSAKRIEHSESWNRLNNFKKELRDRLEAQKAEEGRLWFAPSQDLDNGEKMNEAFELNLPDEDMEQAVAFSSRDTHINELYLWYGISSDNAESVPDSMAFGGFSSICAEQSETDKAEFGAGAYFTEDLSKSLQYAKGFGGSKFVVLCRVACGELYYCKDPKDGEDAESAKKRLGKDTVLVPSSIQRMGARHYVVNDAKQVYPEYILEVREGDGAEHVVLDVGA